MGLPARGAASEGRMARPDRRAARMGPWSRTLLTALWYLPLVHIGYPAMVLWPARSCRVRIPAPLRNAGRFLALTGAALTAWSVYTLVGEGQGTPAPHDPPRALVRRGPYRFCRNPMELGNLLTLVGRAIVAGSPRLAIASLLFAGSVHAWIVLVEEPDLLRRFGPRYRSYQRAIPRWGWSWWAEPAARARVPAGPRGLVLPSPGCHPSRPAG